MTNDEIEVKDGTASAPTEVIIREAAPQGYIAFFRANGSGYFSFAYSSKTNESRDSHRCPYPLFATREDAIDAAKHSLYGNGGEVRVVKITL